MEICIYTMEYPSAIKNGEYQHLHQCNGTEGDYAEWNKSNRDNYNMVSLICGT